MSSSPEDAHAPGTPPRRRRPRRRRMRLRAIVHTRKLQRRVLFLGGGLLVGLAAVSMAFAADWAQRLFRDHVLTRPHAALLVTPLGFALCAWLTRTYFPGARGSGIPQVIAARQIRDPARARPLVSLPVGLAKILLMTLGLLFGASAGREGPTVQVGASIMAALNRVTPRLQSSLLLAGAAAGVAAAFNTPLAGIVFAIEELSQSFEIQASGLLLGTIIAAGVTSLAIVGEYSYFGTSAATLALGTDWLLVILVGAAGGLAGALFGFLLVRFAEGLPGRVGQLIKDHPVAFALLCGLGVALCGQLSGNTVFGTGYVEAKALVEGSGVPQLAFAPLKFLATVFTSISGIPGGIFAPSLAIGAGLGAVVNSVLPETTLSACVLLGMVAYLTGVVQAPITSFVIVLEMTGNHAMIVPLMATSLVAQASSRLVMHEGLYHALARPYREAGAEAPGSATRKRATRGP